MFYFIFLLTKWECAWCDGRKRKDERSKSLKLNCCEVNRKFPRSVYARVVNLFFTCFFSCFVWILNCIICIKRCCWVEVECVNGLKFYLIFLFTFFSNDILIMLDFLKFLNIFLFCEIHTKNLRKKEGKVLKATKHTR